MEVTHVEEATKHVVIGGGRNRAFGIANTAEFVTVLSDALYSNKKLAAVREVMCNAWDAHIASGCTDTPIEVRFTKTSMIIRDYGTGIADDMIEEIYCIYGESTKRNESNTTGGFGLGSKSPFAISDTFMVTSFHKGVRTIYAVSKGTDETDGLPALRSMVSLPTTETGLQVEIPIMEVTDLDECWKYAEKVALFGEMNAKIYVQENDAIEFKPTDFGLKDSEMDFILTSRAMTYDRRRGYTTRIYIQYGAVVYPVTENPAYDREYEAISYRLDHDSRTAQQPMIDHPMLVIRAEPDSLSVNPSREVLSYSSHTIRTIKAHLEKIAAIFAEVRPDLIKNNLDTAFDTHVHNYPKLNNMDDVERFCLSIKDIRKGTSRRETILKITNIEELHNRFLVGQYNTEQFSNYIRKRALRYVQTYREGRWNKLAKMYLFNRRFDKYNLHKLRQYIIKDTLTKLGKEYAQLLSFVHLESYPKKLVKLSSTLDEDFRIGSRWEDYKPFNVIVSVNKISAGDYLKDYNDGSNLPLRTCNVIAVTRVKSALSPQLVADTLEVMGYVVHRVYENPKYTKEPVKAVRTGVKVKRKSGYALARDCIVPTSTRCRYDPGLAEVAGRVTKPKTHILLKQRGGEKIILNTSQEAFALFLEHFPDTVVVTSTASDVKLTLAGSQDMATAVNELAKVKFKEPAFIQAIAYSKGPLNGNIPYYQYLVNIPEIAQEFGLADPSAVTFDKEVRLLEFMNRHTQSQLDFELREAVKLARQALTNALPGKQLIEDRKKYLEWFHYMIDDVEEMKGDNRRVAIELLRVALKG